MPPSSVPCARVSGALSALTSEMAGPSSPWARVNAACRGIKPYTDRISPTTMRNTLKRLGRPEEIADAIVYLGADKASYLTGQIIGVNGGKTAG